MLVSARIVAALRRERRPMTKRDEAETTGWSVRVASRSRGSDETWLVWLASADEAVEAVRRRSRAAPDETVTAISPAPATKLRAFGLAPGGIKLAADSPPMW
jgi:hypothetical protein